MKKRLSSTRLIALAAIIAAIHAVFLLIGRFFPGIELIILIFFPTLTALFIIESDFLHSISYFIATFLICFLIDYNLTLLYLLPALVAGTSFGILIRLKFPRFYIIIVTTLINAATMLLTNWMIKAIYKTDFFEAMKKLLGTENNQFIWTLVIIMSLSQSLLTFVILTEELKRLGRNLIKKDINLLSFILPLISFSLIFIPYSPIAILTSILFIIFLIPVAIHMYYENKNCWVILGCQLVSLLLALPLLNLLPADIFYIAYLIPFIVGILVDLAYYIRSRTAKKNKLVTDSSSSDS